MAHGLILVLMLLLFSSPAQAQDVPALVLLDVDLTWTVPAFSTPVELSGRVEWQNGVGFTDGLPWLANRWTITGSGCEPLGCIYSNETNPANGAHFELESHFIPGLQSFIFSLPQNGLSMPLLPGDYALSGEFRNDFPNPGAGTYFSTSGSARISAVPELAILPVLSRHIGGRRLNRLVNPTLQRMTAWGAAMLLRVLQIPATVHGIYIGLPSVTLEVQEWCSGIVAMKWLTLLALVVALVGAGRLPWKVALIVAAPFIALETNILRVAGIGASIEVFGYASRGTAKEWLGWAAMALGVVQVVGLGWLINRQRARTA